MKLTNKTMVSLAFLTCIGMNAKSQNNKPNIIFILADDLGWKDLSCTGSNYYETPNINRIAAEGIQFNQAYAACQVSSPSRASILTGKYPVNHGITNWIGEPSGEEWRKQGRNSKLLPASYSRKLSTNEITLPKVLKENGYITFIAGKWHLGGEGSTPEDHGFDINIGGHEAGGPYPGGYFSPYGNPKMKDGPKGENLSVRLGTEAANFMETHENTGNKQPFFIYLSFYAVHAPIETTEKNWRYFRDKAVSNGISQQGFNVDRILPARQHQDNPVYAGLIKQMDDAIGIVLDKVEKLGLSDNTIIIFTSDNGGVSSGDNYATSNQPLRGGKGQQWEGGLRVPLLMKCPNYNKEGNIIDYPVSSIDFYPTLLDIANISLPKEQKVDGISYFPLFRKEHIKERPLYWHYPHYGNQGGEPSSVIREGNWKLIHYYEDGRNELYNLVIDSTECEPLNIQHPEKLQELYKKLSKWLKQTDALIPTADPAYNPIAEHRYKKKIQQEKIHQQEMLRNDMLKQDYKPNKDWWGSTTID